ncbi:hypothetical protein [Nonomuraea typhae]|uniref:hypothetical protein n=1 Tax=Nonomuraea typhae TaxID=2603600 RepID=UPI0012FC1E26|nr:hypothetical protein [Nonomuraea typhae]
MSRFKSTLMAAALTTALAGGTIVLGAATAGAASAATSVTAASPVLTGRGSCWYRGKKCTYKLETNRPRSRFFAGHWRVNKKYCPGGKWKKSGFGPCSKGPKAGPKHRYHKNMWLQ